MGAKRRLVRRMLNFITSTRSPPKTLRRPRRRDARGVLLRIGSLRPSPEMEGILESRGKGEQRERHRLMNFSLIG